jgi:hypothetical protein
MTTSVLQNRIKTLREEDENSMYWADRLLDRISMEVEEEEEEDDDMEEIETDETEEETENEPNEEVDEDKE